MAQMVACLSHTVPLYCTLDPRFESHHCFYFCAQVNGSRRLVCHPGKGQEIVDQIADLMSPLHAGNKARKSGIHLGFETQAICHQGFKTGVSVASQKDKCPIKLL